MQLDYSQTSHTSGVPRSQHTTYSQLDRPDDPQRRQGKEKHSTVTEGYSALQHGGPAGQAAIGNYKQCRCEQIVKIIIIQIQRLLRQRRRKLMVVVHWIKTPTLEVVLKICIEKYIRRFVFF